MRATNSSTMVNSSPPLPQELASALTTLSAGRHSRPSSMSCAPSGDLPGHLSDGETRHGEQESPALITLLNDHPDEHLSTSAMGHIELIRAATRAGAAATAA